MRRFGRRGAGGGALPPTVPFSPPLPSCRSSTEYVAFLDDDDQWLPQKLQRQFDRMATDGTQMCCGGGRECGVEGLCEDAGSPDAEGEATNPTPPGSAVGDDTPPTMPRDAAAVSPVLTAADLEGPNPIITSSMVLHVSVTREAGEFGDKQYAQDFA